MQQARICLAMADNAELQKLNKFLTIAGFQVIDASTDGNSAIRRIRSLHPDLIFVDYFMPGIGGQEIAKIAEEANIAPAIIVKPADLANNVWTKPDIGWEFAYLYRPLSKTAILQTIQLVLMSHRKVSKLQTQVEKLKKDLVSRRIIEKAKGLLMTNLGLSEQEAYRRLQKQSMDKGITMKQLAEAIIMTYDLS